MIPVFTEKKEQNRSNQHLIPYLRRLTQGKISITFMATLFLFVFASYGYPNGQMSDSKTLELRKEYRRTNACKHTVQKGDSLYKLALKYYNNGNKWTIIRDANRAILYKNTCKVGQTIIIPRLISDTEVENQQAP